MQEEQYKDGAILEQNKTREQVASDLLSRYGQGVKKVLDIGCGGGTLVKKLSEQGYDVNGLDLPEVVKNCKKRFPDNEFMSFNAEEDTPPVSDAIIALEVVEHLIDDYGFLKRCNTSSNLIILCLPMSDEIQPCDHHLRYYPPESIMKIMTLTGWRVVFHSIVGPSRFFVAVNNRLECEDREWDPDTYLANSNDAEAMKNWLKPVLDCIDIKRGDRVVEFGCGSGKFSAGLSLMGFNVIATDQLEDMLDRVGLNFPRMNLKTVRARIPDMLDDVPKGVDMALAEGLLEHWLNYNERVGALVSMKGVVRDGGYVAIYVPLRQIRPDEHYYPNKDELVKEMLDAGLKNIKSSTFVSTMRLGHKRSYILCVGEK